MDTTPLDDPSANSREEQDIRQLQDQLDRVPAPLQPLDVSAVDGFLCGVVLQPGRNRRTGTSDQPGDSGGAVREVRGGLGIAGMLAFSSCPRISARTRD